MASKEISTTGRKSLPTKARTIELTEVELDVAGGAVEYLLQTPTLAGEAVDKNSRPQTPEFSRFKAT